VIILKCERCGKEIEANKPTIQVRKGYFNEDGEFVAEEDICYLHEECYNVEVNTAYQ